MWRRVGGTAISLKSCRSYGAPGIWTPAQYLAALQHPRAHVGCAQDQLALQMAEVTVRVLPCGRSAHLELEYAVGSGQRTAGLMRESYEAELMYLLVDRLCLPIDDLLAFLRERSGLRCPTGDL